MLDYNTDNPSPFFLLDNIKTVVIDYGVTSVGEKTFKFCESLESVTFPVDGSFKTIGKEAFLFCSALPDVTLPQGLTTIGESAFESSGLTSVTIPGTVTQIGKSAFYGIDSLACVTIPKSVTAIPECAFGYCVDLETINYAGSPADWAAMTIHENAFYKTPVSAPTCYYYGVEGAENAINDIGADDGSYEYLARLATAYVAFHKLSAADKAKVTNADALQTAIDACPGYEFGSCGDCVGYAWNKTTGKVVIGGVGPMWDYDSNTFDDNPSPFLFSDNVKTVVIGYGVTSVGEFTFFECESLESVTFPDDGSFKTIGNYAFTNCFSLTGVTFPRGLTAIGDDAFYGDGLESVTIPGTVTKIGQYAFYSCDLTSVTFPKSLTAIPAGAFAYCSYLECINYTGSPADWAAVTVADDAFEGAPVSAPTSYYYGVEGAENAINDVGVNDGSDAYLARVAAAYVAFNKLSAADKAKVTNADVLQAAIDAALGYEFGQCGNCVGYAWNQTTGKVVIGGCGPMTEYSSSRSPFYGSNEVKTVVIANGVTTVGKSAFSNCRKLESVTFPDDGSLAAIGEYTFEQCQSLQSVALPRGLTTVGTAAFGECSALQSVTFPQGLTAIGAYAFEKCTSLQSVSLPQGLTTIGQRTFHMCTSLENITLPQGLTTIHSLAFYDTGLKSVTIPKSVTKFGDFAFAENSDLQTLNYTGSPADWATVTVAGNAFDNTPVNAPTCYYYGVEGAMNAIDDIGTVTYDDDCKGRIDEARKAYDRLSDLETTLVTNHETLLNAENKYKALEVEALIAAIGTVEYTDECKTKIDAAQAAYTALTAEQLALVDADAVTALADAVNKYDALGVESLIAAIGTVEYTDACKEKIDAAQAAYDGLTADQLALVDADAVTALADTQNKYNALGVEALIAAIGTVAYTAACKEKIDAAQTAYDALTADQLALVDPDAVTALADAATLYDNLGAAAAVEEKIASIGTVELTDESKAKIDAAQEAYNALTADQKSLVNANALTALNNATAAYALLANKAEFEAYKETVKDLAGAMKLDGDSDACLALIEAVKTAVNAVNYDETKYLDTNKAAVDTAADLTKLAADLADQRAAEADDHEEVFEAYRASLLSLAQALRKDGDSEAVTALIDEMIAALTDYAYDETKTLDENEEALSDVFALFANRVKSQRRAERQAELNKQPCSLCGEHHTGSLLENFIGVIHGIIWIMTCVALIAV